MVFQTATKTNSEFFQTTESKIMSNTRLEEENKELKHENQQLKKQIEILNRQLEDLQKQVTQQQSGQLSTSDAIQGLQEKLNKLKEEKSEADKNRVQAWEELKTAVGEVTKLASGI
eukprot:TRINITY_DN5846_c0_g1_i1.p1 TRINITY_DN5846_c0_g1~~TRINITY_DN5846_c0_g1_i1.p1  ORF type:complete len:116 (+),score=13.76 TRINITY_DN5846_c0_g1_i1:48-395(+)